METKVKKYSRYAHYRYGVYRSNYPKSHMRMMYGYVCKCGFGHPYLYHTASWPRLFLTVPRLWLSNRVPNTH